MFDKNILKSWVLESLQVIGSATVAEVAKFIWDHHEAELRGADEVFYTWQYDIR